ncbi:phospholipase effector Tle1 domain-containing protein [Rhizobium sp. ZW T2_16]|uniref:phospholipase effector Tle1 domain-containing protein n=1 Tax=Rhizobium sp. ZW T2_16 TaxID=3378083 RepID=UPI0038544412
MSKNIVILFDGTSNEISADRTNILRLFGALERSEQQIVYYDPGVGTFGASNAWSKVYRNTIEIWGLATGWGMDQNIKEAYRFLIENYDPGTKDTNGSHTDRDRIYIFGFSRGAYSARVLAGFIHALGLMSRQHLNLLDYAYNTWFAGVHGDVGGGYPEPDSGQVKIPLEWMIRETEPTGLLYRTQTVEDIVKGQRSNRYVSLNATADLHDSMSLGWKPLEYLPRRVPENSWRKRGDSRSIYIPFRDRRFIPERAMLHSSVRIRMEGGGYNPPNLPKDPFFVD